MEPVSKSDIEEMMKKQMNDMMAKMIEMQQANMASNQGPSNTGSSGIGHHIEQAGPSAPHVPSGPTGHSGPRELTGITRTGRPSNLQSSTDIERRPGESRIIAARRRLTNAKDHEEYKRMFRRIKKECMEDLFTSSMYSRPDEGQFPLYTCRWYQVGRCTKQPAHQESKNNPTTRVHLCQICAECRNVGMPHTMVNCSLLVDLENEMSQSTAVDPLVLEENADESTTEK